MGIEWFDLLLLSLWHPGVSNCSMLSRMAPLAIGRRSLAIFSTEEVLPHDKKLTFVLFTAFSRGTRLRKASDLVFRRTRNFVRMAQNLVYVTIFFPVV